jgi:hypothetical protein
MADALKLLLQSTSTGSTTQAAPQQSYQGDMKSTVLSVVFRAILIILLVALILVLIHFLVYPIFKMNGDEPGFIPVPSVAGDDKLFWRTKTDVAPLAAADTPLGSTNSATNYSLTVDIQIDDAHNYTGAPRIIFYKGDNIVPIPRGREPQATIASMITNPSLVFALTRDTNDLQISVITQEGNTEGILLYNVPMRKAFRIGIILSNKTLEVYTNGMLSRTRSLTSPPKSIQGKFWPSPTTGVQLRNLHIWPTTIMPVEMRTALPALSTSNFDVTSLQETSSCATAASALSATARSLASLT